MSAAHRFLRACKSSVPACTTAWDYPSALLAETAGMDLILIGDSTAIVALGQPSTIGITLDQMIYHCKSVKVGAKSPFLLGDLPMGSYEVSPQQGVESAIRMVKESQVDGVKLEGGVEMAPTVAAIVKAGITVIGHIGLTPQRACLDDSDNPTYGQTAAAAKSIWDDAVAIQEAGALAIVMEAVAGPVARMVTERLKIPTIGIGCGPNTTAQMALQSELLGYQKTFLESWHKKYTNVGEECVKALRSYKEEVASKSFPNNQTTQDIPEEEQKQIAEVMTSK
ncbi:hypothetical protein VE02_09874 [Pseudogymnoascus sp. 03VT05]|nr:hypothetical protein VE02_09874 [Pseudogymnoascus sp. 03VT05]